MDTGRLSKGAVLATASYDHAIRLWNPTTADCISTLQHPESQVNALAITPDLKRLAAAGYQHIRMYDLESDACTPILDFEGVSKNVTAVGFHSDGRWMFTGGEDCSARVWDLRANSREQLTCQRIFQVNTAVNCICLHPNQTELFVGDASGTIHLWDLRTDHNEQLLPEPNSPILHLDVDSAGTMLAAVNNKGVVYVWNLVGSPSVEGGGTAPSTRLIPKIKVPVHERAALKCRFSPDSTLLATTSADQTAKLWRTADFAEACTLRSEKDQRWVWDCAFTADSQLIYTVSSDGIMKLWSIEGGSPLKLYSGFQKAMTALAFADPQCSI